MKDNVKSVIQRAVERHKQANGDDYFTPAQELSLVVDTSPIRIAELEAKLTEIAHNLHTSVDKVLAWSADVGEALTLMDDTLEDNEKLRAIMGMAKAHLVVASELPKAEDSSNYVEAALHILKSVPKKEEPHEPGAGVSV